MESDVWCSREPPCARNRNLFRDRFMISHLNDAPMKCNCAIITLLARGTRLIDNFIFYIQYFILRFLKVGDKNIILSMLFFFPPTYVLFKYFTVPRSFVSKEKKEKKICEIQKTDSMSLIIAIVLGGKYPITEKEREREKVDIYPVSWLRGIQINLSSRCIGDTVSGSLYLQSSAVQRVPLRSDALHRWGFARIVVWYRENKNISYIDLIKHLQYK